MIRRKGIACLLVVVVFLLLRGLSHATPLPLPGTSGFFDANGLDDMLQAIRIDYAPAGDGRHATAGVRVAPTGRVALPELPRPETAFIASSNPRAPPGP